MASSALYGLAQVTTIILNLILGIMIISVGISWFQPDPRNQFVGAIRSLSEPMYRPFRFFTRRIPGPFDFAPFCAMMVVVFLQKALPLYLMGLAMQSR